MNECAIAVLGPMKAGKSLYIINQYQRWVRAGLKTIALVPRIATARDGAHIRSRAGAEIEAQVFDQPGDILNLVRWAGAQAVVADDMQLCDAGAMPDLGVVMQDLKRLGVHLMFGALQRDFLDRPFPATLQILPHATRIVTLSATCDVCHCKGARYNQRLIDGMPASPDQPMIAVEGTNPRETYQVRCRRCFVDMLPYGHSGDCVAD